MVFIPPPQNIPRLNAYLLPSFPDTELGALKRAFELGTCAPFHPILELVIQRAPEDYADKPYEYMRTKETEAGRTDPFVLVDARGSGGREGAVWYVDRFASSEEVDDGEAESTDVVWRILVKTECLALMHVNYDIANMTLQEDLERLGVDFPVSADFELPEADSCGGLDMLEQRRRQTAYVVAYPGAFDESTDEEDRRTFLPLPDRVARLKDGVAETVGLVNRWSIPGTPRPHKMPDGSLREFPEGSAALQFNYDPDFDWPEYRWPEGSL